MSTCGWAQISLMFVSPQWYPSL